MNVQGLVVFSLVLLMHVMLRAEEFLYPVGILGTEQDQHVLLLYQKDLQHLELWAWDPTTKQTVKALLSTYTPAALRVLPSGQGFSFIDNGRIKIKMINKRSPKSLDIYEPIYNIGLIEWVTDHYGYCSAKLGDYHAIFQLSWQGEVDLLVAHKMRDCMYPQKVGDFLFYIERMPCDQGFRYAIIKNHYPTITYPDSYAFNQVESYQERVAELLRQEGVLKKLQAHCKPEQQERLIDFEDHAVAFLQMISEHQGIVLEHAAEIDKQDKTMAFDCHLITDESGTWQVRYLFSFEIPLALLLPESESQLYESILPLLPRKIGSTLWYADCSHDRYLHILHVFSYDLETGCHRDCSVNTDMAQHCFVPLQVGSKLFYGGTIGDETEKRNGLRMWINDDGVLCVDMPCM